MVFIALLTRRTVIESFILLKALESTRWLIINSLCSAFLEVQGCAASQTRIFLTVLFYDCIRVRLSLCFQRSHCFRLSLRVSARPCVGVSVCGPADHAADAGR